VFRNDPEALTHPTRRGYLPCIEVNRIGPETDGYLLVGVGTDIAVAQTWFEAEYRDELFRFIVVEPIRHGGWHRRVEPV
jgi:hypothetical protein